jgi:cell division protein FtsZ
MENNLDSTVKIKVMGVGGGGGNAVNRMVSQKNEFTGVDFISANTDLQALGYVKAKTKLQLGAVTTNGMGSGADPSVGKKAAEESADAIKMTLEGANILFITAGMGGGTGTGASPVIAKIAHDMGIVTVAVVTKPFDFEGTVRAKIAEEGLNELRKQVDGMMIIPNQRLFRIEGKNITIANAFKKADEVLSNGVAGITELVQLPGLINLDFADFKTILCAPENKIVANESSDKRVTGTIWMGLGVGIGEERAQDAIRNAMSYSLIESSPKGAKNVLYNVVGNDISMDELDIIAHEVSEQVDKDARIIFGYAEDSSLKRDDDELGGVRIVMVASGLSDVFDETSKAKSDFKKVLHDVSFSRQKPNGQEAPADIVVDIPAILRKKPGMGNG